MIKLFKQQQDLPYFEDFSAEHKILLRDLDASSYFGPTFIGHGLSKDMKEKYYVITINEKTGMWTYHKDHVIEIKDIQYLLKKKAILPTSNKYQYVLNQNIFRNPLVRMGKNIKQNLKKRDLDSK